MNLLIFNCWSYSVSFNLFDWKDRRPAAAGSVERVTLDGGKIVVHIPGREPHEMDVECPTHESAIRTVAGVLTMPPLSLLQARNGIDAIVHRVVHGGDTFHGGTLLDEGVLTSLRKLASFAPLHLPYNLAGIEGAMRLFPDVPQVAVFDTAFHQTMPEEAYLYPLPYEWYERKGVRRYGFHGHAHLHAAQCAALLLGKPLQRCNLVTVAVGRGISVCAIRNGKSIDTSMGMTPLEGAVMETRCGDIDPGLSSFIMNRLNLSPAELYMILNKKSGLLGITGNSDRTQLEKMGKAGDSRSLLALEMQGYRLRKQIGAYVAAIGKTDAIVFAASGDADLSLLREQSLAGLDSMGIILDKKSNRHAPAGKEGCLSAPQSPISVLSVQAQPERVMCEEAISLLGTRSPEKLALRG